MAAMVEGAECSFPRVTGANVIVGMESGETCTLLEG